MSDIHWYTQIYSHMNLNIGSLPEKAFESMHWNPDIIAGLNM